ncbi:MAG: hypothetical protein ACYC9S_12335, partial [Leptospirales bacterium]
MKCPNGAFSIADIETKVGYSFMGHGNYGDRMKCTRAGDIAGTNASFGKNDQSQSGTMKFWNDIGQTAICTGAGFIPYISTLKKGVTTTQEFYNLYSKLSGPATTYTRSTSSDTYGNTIMYSDSMNSPICSTFGIDNGTQCTGGLGGPFTNYFTGITADQLYIPCSNIGCGWFLNGCLHSGMPGIKIQSMDLMNP